MAQIQKVEGQVEIMSHADKFFEAWARKPYCINKMCPGKITNTELHEGESWHALGSKQTWSYTLGNERASVTKIVEEMDDSSRVVTYNIIDGFVMKHYYESLKCKMQVIPKGERSIVKWSFEYEKKNADAPEPKKYVDFLLSCAKDMDSNL